MDDLTDENLRTLKKRHIQNAEDGICRAAHDGCCLGWSEWPCLIYQMADEIQRLRVLEDALATAARPH